MDFKFDAGWVAPIQIHLFGVEYSITLRMKSYRESDGITVEQDQAYADYSVRKEQIQKQIETELLRYAADAEKRFSPRTLLVQRDGAYALLCDDANYPDEGIAICVKPYFNIVSQDEYL